MVLELADQLDVDPAEVEAALPRLLTLALAQSERYDRSRASLVEALQGDLGLIDPLPRASISQARRTAELRNRLLASGAWAVPALAEVRDVTEGTARTWLKRQRDAHRLVTVTVHREVYVPAVLLDEAAEPWPGVEAMLEPLVDVGMDGWAVWAWLDTPSSWLGGERPADLLAGGDVSRAARAATAKASTAASDLAGRHVSHVHPTDEPAVLDLRDEQLDRLGPDRSQLVATTAAHYP